MDSWTLFFGKKKLLLWFAHMLERYHGSPPRLHTCWSAIIHRPSANNCYLNRENIPMQTDPELAEQKTHSHVNETCKYSRKQNPRFKHAFVGKIYCVLRLMRTLWFPDDSPNAMPMPTQNSSTGLPDVSSP